MSDRKPRTAIAIVSGIIVLAIIGGMFLLGFFHFTLTPAPNLAELRRSPIQQVYQ